MANEELHMNQSILVLTARQTTGAADSTTATIVGQMGDHPFTVSGVSSKSIRLSSSGPGVRDCGIRGTTDAMISGNA